MTPPFTVYTTAHFDRLAQVLQKGHSDFAARYARALAILGSDPYNRAGAHTIKKLEAVPSGAGQWRLRLGRFRFRYDIFGRKVWLLRCHLRREDTYRR